MDATGAVRVVTRASDPHLWRALTVSVGRLGIILELTFAVEPNRSVTRSKEVRRAASKLKVAAVWQQSRWLRGPPLAINPMGGLI
jgi:hypothetical protein